MIKNEDINFQFRAIWVSKANFLITLGEHVEYIYPVYDKWLTVHSIESFRNRFYLCTLPFKMFWPFWSVWCKMALAEVGVSLPWWCHALVLLVPGYWSLFLNLSPKSATLPSERAIFQTFWRLHCCTDSLFFEIETSNFGSSYVFWNPLKWQGWILLNFTFWIRNWHISCKIQVPLFCSCKKCFLSTIAQKVVKNSRKPWNFWKMNTVSIVTTL
jgi:hypothetical protein